MHRNANALIATWLLFFSIISRAADRTFAEDIAVYDWTSLLLAGAAGVLGGAGRTLASLQSEKWIVGSTKWVLLRDVIVAMMGGAFAYLCISGYNESGMNFPRVDRGFRVLIIVIAGASGGRWLRFIDNIVTDLVLNARQKARGEAKSEHQTPLSTNTAPLEKK